MKSIDFQDKLEFLNHLVMLADWLFDFRHMINKLNLQEEKLTKKLFPQFNVSIWFGSDGKTEIWLHI